jgi:REP element-mobilizing transposase RayT
MHRAQTSDRSGRHHRRSIRLQGYDYSQSGTYFVTICTKARACLFGEVVDGEMVLNPAGTIVDDEWRLSAVLRDELELDEWVVMPNHVHGIVVVDTFRMGDRAVGAYGHTPLRSPSKTVGAMVRGFKSAATKRINELRHRPRVPVWQRNYYEHIIRDDDDLSRIRQYILDNPSQWAFDRENPAIVDDSSAT